MLLYLWKKIRLMCAPKPVEDNWSKEVHLAKVISVYDGDTITVSLIRNGCHVLQKVRLSGYDTPEMKPPLAQANRDNEIKMAKRAREDLISRIGADRDTGAGGYVWMVCDGREKYGRILGTIHRVTFWGGRETPSINEWMIKNSLATPYSGGTKKKW